MLLPEVYQGSAGVVPSASLYPPSCNPAAFSLLRGSTAPMADSSLRFTPTLPTEPGTYLFIGVADISSHSSDQVRPELVRVTRTDQGLQFIGRDFFYAVQRAEGLWARLDLGSAEDAAQLRCERRLARYCAQGAFSGTWDWAAATELSTYALQRRLPAGVGTRGQQVFGLMVNYCVIRQTNPDCPEWDARWALADAPAEDPADGGCTIRWSV